MAYVSALYFVIVRMRYKYFTTKTPESCFSCMLFVNEHLSLCHVKLLVYSFLYNKVKIQ